MLESDAEAMNVASIQKTTINRTATAATNPVVSSVGGMTINASGIVNGRAAMDTGKAYNGVMVVNDRDADNIAWYINGVNFENGDSLP